MTYSKWCVLALVAAGMLCVAPMASASVPCKSGQKAVHKGSPACTPAAAAKAHSGSKAKGKSKLAVKTQAKGKHGTMASAPVALEPLPSLAPANCESVQTLLQGGGAQCPAVAAPRGLALPVPPQANPGAACFEALASSQASRRLAGKVPFLSDSAAGPEALANTGVPTKSEKEALGSVLAGYGMCLDMAASWRQAAYVPALVGALDAFWLEAKSILGALAAGKKNFGDAARALADNDKVYLSKLGTLEKPL